MLGIAAINFSLQLYIYKMAAQLIVILSACFEHTRFPLFTNSINWYRHKLGAKYALHMTHWPRVRGLAASAGVWPRAMELRSAPPYGPLCMDFLPEKMAIKMVCVLMVTVLIFLCTT